jgi:ABC-type molybdate transport system permease subunit
MHTMFAQSLGEYGALGSLGSGIQQLTYSISTWLGSLSATTWIIAAIVVLGLVILTRR